MTKTATESSFQESPPTPVEERMNKLITLLTVFVVCIAAAPIPAPAPAKSFEPTHILYVGDAVQHCILPLGFAYANEDHRGFKVRRARTKNGTVYYTELVSRKHRELTVTTTDVLVVEI